MRCKQRSKTQPPKCKASSQKGYQKVDAQKYSKGGEKSFPNMVQAYKTKEAQKGNN